MLFVYFLYYNIYCNIYINLINRKFNKIHEFTKEMVNLICLGIESTAHTFSIGIVNEKKVLAVKSSMYTNEKGGIIPADAAAHHRKVRDLLLAEALNELYLSMENIDVIAFSKGPGLAPCLLAGKEFSLGLAKKYSKPLVPVNHIAAHLEIGKFFTKAKDPVFVFTSGANTQIITHASSRYRIIGECLSIAIGNSLDKFGRAAGLGFPAGPKIEQLALKGKYIELPYVVKGMDVEFSGIVTAAIQKLKNNKLEDVCFSLQETLFSMTAEITERALAHTQKKEALLIGGVAANKRFAEMLSIMCKERGAKFYFCPVQYAGDNGVQIAILGLLQYKSSKIPSLKDIDINPNWRVDEVETSWIKE